MIHKIIFAVPENFGPLIIMSHPSLTVKGAGGYEYELFDGPSFEDNSHLFEDGQIEEIETLEPGIYRAEIEVKFSESSERHIIRFTKPPKRIAINP